MRRAVEIRCFCGRDVRLRLSGERRGRVARVVFYLGVCRCGRGIDVYVDAEPASEPSG